MSPLDRICQPWQPCHGTCSCLHLPCGGPDFAANLGGDFALLIELPWVGDSWPRPQHSLAARRLVVVFVPWMGAQTRRGALCDINCKEQRAHGVRGKTHNAHTGMHVSAAGRNTALYLRNHVLQMLNADMSDIFRDEGGVRSSENSTARGRGRHGWQTFGVQARLSKAGVIIIKSLQHFHIAPFAVLRSATPLAQCHLVFGTVICIFALILPHCHSRDVVAGPAIDRGLFVWVYY